MKLLDKLKQRKDRKAVEAKLEQARNAQRNGRIQEYVSLMAEAEALRPKEERS